MANYYVSTTGNNSNSGAFGSPWRTINYAVQQLAPGDNLYIYGGTYKEKVDCIRSGTATKMITIAAYAEEHPIIDGDNYALPSSDWGVLFKVSGDYIFLNQLTVQYSNWIGIMIAGNHCVANSLTSCYHKENGILVTGSYSTVEYCHVHHTAMSNENGTPTRTGWAGGINAARHPVGSKIKGNSVYTIWGEGISTFEAEDTVIESNYCFDCYSTNYYLSDTTGTTMKGNISYHTPNMTIGTNAGLMVGDEKYTPASANNTIINNLFYGSYYNFFWWQGDSGGGLNNVLIANNTFVNALNQNIRIGAGEGHSNTKFENNIILQEDSADISYIGSTTGITFAKNIWSKVSSSGSGATDIIANPLLAKVGSTGATSLTYLYFELLDGSPAIDAGLNLAEVSVDYLGNSRGASTSIGALENVSTTSGSSEIPPPPTSGSDISTGDGGNDTIPPDATSGSSDSFNPLAFISHFDYFNIFENPTFILCNPNREKLYAMRDIYDINVKYCFNATGELSFVVPKNVNGANTEYYGLIEYPRLIYIENKGYFVIINVQRSGDGIKETKEVTCYSLEYIMASKKLVKFEGTYKFYDLVDPTKTLLQTLISYVPGWKIGDVDASLMGKYRTFDETDTNVYNFLMEKVETAYQCAFTFDTINRTINAHVPSQASSVTDIFLSPDNVIKSFDLEPVNDELVTALSVYGAGDLSINTVNPLGTNTIYNYNYFENTNWMSQGLIDALNSWELKIESYQGVYADLLTSLKTRNAELVTLEGELVDLNSELEALKVVRKVRLEQGLDIRNITAQIESKKAEINNKTREIELKNGQISTLKDQLKIINDALKFATNFTTSQLEELSNYTFGATYQNENFIQTDSMTEEEIQDMAQRLYDQATDVLTKTSVPRYTFSVDSVNFLFLKDFQNYINQLKLGCTITVKPNDDLTIYPVLLEVSLSYDNPEDFSLTFSNRLRLDTAEYQYGDLFGKTQDLINTTSFNSEMWSNWTDGYKDDVTNFIDSALDASLNNIISSVNQEIKIDSMGLTGKRYLPETSTYSPEQIWLTSNLIVFTDDNWNTARTALGKIFFNGISTYGLVAETLVGNIIAGNELIITNENNTFRIDESGVTITDANVNITTLNGNSRILIDPINGLKIQKKNGTVWADKLYADSEGNLNLSGNLVAATGSFSGKITATEGSIGGITINSKGIQKDANNYIRSNGDFKWGMLTMSGGNATFNGNIYANNLLGLLQYNQIGSVNADTIVTGTLEAIDIYGCNIYWPGVTMHATGTGVSEILAENSLDLIVNQQSIVGLRQGMLALLNHEQVLIGWTVPTGLIKLTGSIYTKNSNFAGGYGVNESIVVNTPLGNRKLDFINGLLTIQAGNVSTTLPVIENYFTDFGFTAVIPVDATGVVGHTEIPFNCQIDSVRVTSETSCSVVVDISIRPFATFSSVADASITGGVGITLNGKTYENTTLTGWTTNLTGGDYLTFSVETATGATETINIAIKGKR
jgi:hypothetical protein